MESERMEQMLTQLIQMVGHTNAAVASLQKDMAEVKVELSEVKDTVMRIEYRMNIVEHKQVKMGTRLDTVEAKVEMLSTQNKN